MGRRNRTAPRDAATPEATFPFGDVVETLKGIFSDDVPVVTKVSRESGKNPFLVLVSTLLSLRTKDETTEKVMEKLSGMIEGPRDILDIPLEELQALIYPVGFYRNKAKVLRDVSTELLSHHEGRVPDSLDDLLKIRGVGRKTANLVVTEAFRKPGICVDTHVHRISNRLGAVKTRTPHDTEFALREVLPKRYWIIYNTLLVTFGKRICTPLSPRCSVCPIWNFCMRSGVTRHR